MSAAPAGEPILEVKALRCGDGEADRLGPLDLVLRPGEVVAVIGPRSADRILLLDLLGGLVADAGGTIRLGGRALGRLPATRRLRLGLARGFAAMPPLPAATIGDAIGLAVGLADAGPLALLAGRTGSRGRAGRERVGRLLARVRLADLADHPVLGLPLAYRRLLDLGRALAAAPQLLLLEHPWVGLGRLERLEHARILRELAQDGMAILLVEDDIELIAELAERVLVMVDGRIVAEGEPARIGAMPAARRAMAGSGTGEP